MVSRFGDLRRNFMSCKGGCRRTCTPIAAGYGLSAATDADVGLPCRIQTYPPISTFVRTSLAVETPSSLTVSSTFSRRRFRAGSRSSAALAVNTAIRFSTSSLGVAPGPPVEHVVSSVREDHLRREVVDRQVPDRPKVVALYERTHCHREKPALVIGHRVDERAELHAVRGEATRFPVGAERSEDRAHRGPCQFVVRIRLDRDGIEHRLGVRNGLGAGDPVVLLNEFAAGGRRR